MPPIQIVNKFIFWLSSERSQLWHTVVGGAHGTHSMADSMADKTTRSRFPQTGNNTKAKEKA